MHLTMHCTRTKLFNIHVCKGGPNFLGNMAPGGGAYFLGNLVRGDHIWGGGGGKFLGKPVKLQLARSL